MARPKKSDQMSDAGVLSPADLVKMVRDEPQYTGVPTTADIHPDNVADMLAHGWQII